MLFNSGHFLLFFPLVILFYFLFPFRFRWVFLLAASYYFYMCWRWEYTILIVASTITDYLVALKIERVQSEISKRRWLMISIFLNLSLLFVFKYANFALDTANELMQLANMEHSFNLLEIALPVGISFYTFQSLAYTVDVYRGQTKAERHFGIFALFVVFWPQLVAGPIERSHHLLPQFRQRFRFDEQRTIFAINKIAYGFFKKVVVADRLAIYVNEVYGNVEDYSAIPFIIASIFFAVQIYCDFSGYTDIAIGCASIMGFTLMDNFDRPYLASSITEFWRRWHISLSTWFKDYVYIPIGGNRVVKWRWYYNLFITFLLSGVWHGANWTFVIWGAWHGGLLVMERVLESPKRRLLSVAGIARWPHLVKLTGTSITFFLVVLGWVFFRAGNAGDAFLILEKIFTMQIDTNTSMLMAQNGPFNFLMSLFVIGLLGISYLLPKNLKLRHNLAFAVCVTIIILILGKGGNGEFIYFQF